MDLFLKILMLLLFFAIMVGVGLSCRRHSRSVDGFVLGGRSVGAWFTAFAYGTSYFSAVILVGYSGQFGWKYGIASTWIGIGNAVIGSYLAWIVLGRRTRIMTQHLGSRTMPDFFAKRYGSESLKTGAALIIFLFLIPYAASLYNGLSRLFAMAFGINYTVCIVGMTVLTAAYVVAGGYMATVINDFIQGIIMLFGIVAIVAASLKQFGGLSEAMVSLARVSDSSVSEAPGIFTSFFGPDPFNLLCVVILTSLGTWSLPQMTQKFYAIKNESAIHKGTVISTLFALVVAGGCYFLGGFGRLLSSRVDVAAQGYDAIIPTMFETFSPLLIGLVVILVLSASMSTLSSLVLTASSTLTLDFIQPKFCARMKDSRQISVIRVLILIFVTLSAILAIVQYQYKFAFIAQLMGLSWGAMAGAFLGPYLYGLYWKRTSAAAVWVSYIFGVGVMLLNMFFPAAFPTFLRSSINCGVFAMLGSLVLTPLVSLLTKKPGEAHLERVFACYGKTVTVTVRDSIGDEAGEPAKP
ncbi:MAG: sodium:solute symporter [Oscillospiraceae bacterium]|nr:sodium:solute symporter [Oscillospiraceae bacterium]